MPNIAILGSTIQGMTTGEHHGHSYPQTTHGACTLTGTVTQGSPKMKVGGVGVALQNYPTSEDDCCGAGSGNLRAVAHKIRVSGQWVQLVGDPINPHNGTAVITSGSSKVRSV